MLMIVATNKMIEKTPYVRAEGGFLFFKNPNL